VDGCTRAVGWNIRLWVVALGFTTEVDGATLISKVVHSVFRHGRKRLLSSSALGVAALVGLTALVLAVSLDAAGAPLGGEPRTQASPPQTVLDGILGRVPNSPLKSAQLAGPPAGMHLSDDPATTNPESFAQTLWLYETVNVRALTPEATAKPLWIANLITGALRDELAASGGGPLYSSQVNVETPSGSTLGASVAGVGEDDGGESFSDASDKSIRSHITDAATQLGLTVDSITIYHVDQPAPAVVVTSSDPAAVAAAPQQMVASLLGGPNTYEGLYVEIRDTSGALIYLEGSSARTAGGQSWLNPQFADSASK
jgi:hypothetical protein